jgi:hypothetical protein
MRRKIAGQESVEAVFEARCTASQIRFQRRLRKSGNAVPNKKGLPNWQLACFDVTEGRSVWH